MKPTTGNTASGLGKVLCVVGWWPQGTNVTGIFIREHVKAIARELPVVVVYMEVVKGTSPWPSTKVEHTHTDGIPTYIVTVRTPVRRFGFYRVLARRAYRKLLAELQRTDPFELVHIHVRTDVTEQVLSVARNMRLPVVLTEHNSYYHLGIRNLPPSAQRAERAAIRRWLADPLIKKVMPVSNDLAGVLRDDYGVSDARMVVVPNVAASVFAHSNERPSGPFRMMLAAVWRPPKDPDVFIQALLLLPPETVNDIVVDWVGYGPDMDRIRQMCSAELPQLDIRFPGYLDKTAMASHMQASHLFVLPTKADNLPCVVLESLCCGTPVLSMAVNGLPELVDDTNGLLVPPNDPGALAKAIVTCIEQPDRFDRTAIAAEALSKFTEAAVASRIMSVYRSLTTADGPAT